MNEVHKYASEEHLRYAKVLGTGVQIGFVLLVLSFLLHMFGVLEPLVPNDQLPKYWGLPVADFVKATHTPTGWGWVSLVHKGDMLNLVGIALLAGISAVSSLAVLPIFARRGETAHLVIALLQILVLVISASDILAAAR